MKKDAISIQIDAADATKLRQKAKMLGISISSYARMLVLRGLAGDNSVQGKALAEAIQERRK